MQIVVDYEANPIRSIHTTPKIMAAGMEAKAHLIIKITIDSNGICISVTTTLLDSDLLSSATEVADAEKRS